LPIREDHSPEELRSVAKAERDVRVARRLLAIANALSGMSREAAARSAGMDRQTLRDWVIRYNADGIEGLADRWGEGRPPRLDADQQAELARVILAGPDPEVDGISAYAGGPRSHLHGALRQAVASRFHEPRRAPAGFFPTEGTAASPRQGRGRASGF